MLRRSYRRARSFLRTKTGKRVKTVGKVLALAAAIRYAPRLAPFVAKRLIKPVARRYIRSRVRAYTANNAYEATGFSKQYVQRIHANIARMRSDPTFNGYEQPVYRAPYNPYRTGF